MPEFKTASIFLWRLFGQDAAGAVNAGFICTRKFGCGGKRLIECVVELLFGRKVYWLIGLIQLFWIQAMGGIFRTTPQKVFRRKLADVSDIVHRPFAEIIRVLPDDVILPALGYPGFRELIDSANLPEAALKSALQIRISQV
jgi:hypothetical protein